MRRIDGWIGGVAFLLLVPGAVASEARAQDAVVQPADEMREQSEERTGDGSVHESVTRAPRAVRQRGAIREEDLVGEYRQPLWATRRRFPTTRIYVRPPGTAQFEWWLELKQSLRHVQDARYRSQFEWEFGLGHHLQLDLYLSTQQTSHHGGTSGGAEPFHIHEEKVEIRWALADWDVIPGNPTLYLEFVRNHDGPSRLEGKLLFGGQITSRLHWGANLVWERELAGHDLANELNVIFAGSYTLIDEIFSLGLELKLEEVDVRGARFAFDNFEVLGGPSIQWSPVPAMFVDLVALFGAETEGDGETSTTTPLAEPTIVVGWQF